jgi:ferredoxin
VKKFCIYSVYRKRGYDQRQMFDTADSLCKNCFRCVQGCYGRILSKSRNPEFWTMGDDYWTPEIIASNQTQAETGKIPVSGGGYGGRFSGPGFDSMWTDMSEIVRPTRDGIHGREYISTTVELGRIPETLIHRAGPDAAQLSPILSEMTFPPRVEASIPLIFDLLPFGGFNSAVRLALAKAALEANTLMIIRVEDLTDEFLPFATHLVPFLPGGTLEGSIPAIRRARMVQISFSNSVMEAVEEVKKINPGAVVCLRLSLTPRAEEEVESLARAGAEVLHILADEKGREQNTASPRFIKDLIRKIHLRLVKESLRDRLSLIFGGGIALAEHVAKAIICGADAVSIERPLLFALECRLCKQCDDEITCPVEVENIDPEWGRQRVVNMITAWHGQLLEVLGAMGMRDVRRLRGEAGRAIFLEEVEKETFGQIFGESVQEEKVKKESLRALST